MNSHKLDKKTVSLISYGLYNKLNNNNDYNDIDKILDFFNLDDLINTKNNGLISNLLNLYILLSDNSKIIQIIEKTNKLENFKLMKRDYLNLVKYYYDKDINLANFIFDNNVFSFQSKDIDFLIQNNLFLMLKKLDGLFINSTIDYHLVNPENIPLKLHTLKQDKIDIISNKIKELISSELENIGKFNLDKYNVIIDAGNILHNNKGFINHESINNLKKIINYTTSIGFPLVIIHKKHIKKYPLIIQIFNFYKVKYYFTPFGFNDDLFILWFFLKSNTKAYIISNDKYRDHIFNFDIEKIDCNLEFKFIINQQTLSYNENYIIDTIPQYSNSIQVINDKIYIPHLSGKFIQI